MKKPKKGVVALVYCKNHPKYRGIKNPKVFCWGCLTIYNSLRGETLVQMAEVVK